MAKKKQRKRKVDKYAHLNEPQAELDYHGKGVLTENEIITMAEEFVQEAVRRGLTRLLIITGKGNRSKNGPVVKPTLYQFLPKIPQVKYVKEARIDRGGSGALEVDLR